MIKLTKPAAWITMGEVSFIPPTVDHETYKPYYTEAQLKQTVRDVLEGAAKKCDDYAELCEREQGQTTLYGHIRASAAHVLAIEIRALIKEIE